MIKLYDRVIIIAQSSQPVEQELFGINLRETTELMRDPFILDNTKSGVQLIEFPLVLKNIGKIDMKK